MKSSSLPMGIKRKHTRTTLSSRKFLTNWINMIHTIDKISFAQITCDLIKWNDDLVQLKIILTLEFGLLFLNTLNETNLSKMFLLNLNELLTLMKNESFILMRKRRRTILTRERRKKDIGK